MKLSVLLVAKNAEPLIGKTLESVREISDEVLVLDNVSSDNTKAASKDFGAKVFTVAGNNLGKLKNYLIRQATKDWILLLDSDEVVSPELNAEIKKLLKKKTHYFKAYRIPYQNYVFGRPVYYGGERYDKVRLFLKDAARVQNYHLHEDVILKEKPGRLLGKIYHSSYRNPWQLFKKFTAYASISSKIKQSQNEKLTFKKLFVYGPHMFWARFVKEQGWRDGWRGLVLAIAFAYMEGFTYCFLAVRTIFSYAR